jgi:hypothetical protein
MSVGYWSPWQCCDLTFVAAQHCQVTGEFMWGLFALCGWYYSFRMLMQMQIYFKFCVNAVSIDDICTQISNNMQQWYLVLLQDHSICLGHFPCPSSGVY